MQSLKMTHEHIKIELQDSSLQTCDETDRQEQDFQCSTTKMYNQITTDNANKRLVGTFCSPSLEKTYSVDSEI